MNRNMSLCGVVVASLLLPACATVTRGTSQKYTIVSQPSGAEVKLSSGQTCITPCELKLKRRPGFTATVNKKGYKPSEVTVESKLAGGGAVAGAGNLLAGGLIGGIVDGSNGSMNNLTPNPLKVTLLPEDTVLSTATEAAPVVAETATAAPVEASEAAEPATPVATGSGTVN